MAFSNQSIASELSNFNSEIASQRGAVFRYSLDSLLNDAFEKAIFIILFHVRKKESGDVKSVHSGDGFKVYELNSNYAFVVSNEDNPAVALIKIAPEASPEQLSAIDALKKSGSLKEAAAIASAVGKSDVENEGDRRPPTISAIVKFLNGNDVYSGIEKVGMYGAGYLYVTGSQKIGRNLDISDISNIFPNETSMYHMLSKFNTGQSQFLTSYLAGLVGDFLHTLPAVIDAEKFISQEDPDMQSSQLMSVWISEMDGDSLALVCTDPGINQYAILYFDSLISSGCPIFIYVADKFYNPLDDNEIFHRFRNAEVSHINLEYAEILGALRSGNPKSVDSHRIFTVAGGRVDIAGDAYKYPILQNIENYIIKYIENRKQVLEDLASADNSIRL